MIKVEIFCDLNACDTIQKYPYTSTYCGHPLPDDEFEIVMRNIKRDGWLIEKEEGGDAADAA